MTGQPLNLDEVNILIRKLGGNDVARMVVNDELVPTFTPKVHAPARENEMTKVIFTPLVGKEDSHGMLTCQDKKMRLIGLQWRIIFALFNAPEHVLSMAELQQALKSKKPTTASVNSTLQRLRRRLEAELGIRDLIKNFRGHGHQLNTQYL